jgi:hypothetical protein
MWDAFVQSDRNVRCVRELRLCRCLPRRAARRGVAGARRARLVRRFGHRDFRKHHLRGPGACNRAGVSRRCPGERLAPSRSRDLAWSKAKPSPCWRASLATNDAVDSAVPHQYQPGATAALDDQSHALIRQSRREVPLEHLSDLSVIPRGREAVPPVRLAGGDQGPLDGRDLLLGDGRARSDRERPCGVG